MSDLILSTTLQQLYPLSPEALDMLMSIAIPQSVKRGTWLLREGEHCRNIWFITSGQLRTYFNKEGKEVNLQFSFEKDFVTDLKSVRNNTRSEVNIVAAENTELWAFPTNGLLALYEQSADITAFGRTLLEQLLTAQEELARLFQLYTPAERYEYLQQHRPQLIQRISQTRLASWLGMSRETLSRIRKRIL